MSNTQWNIPESRLARAIFAPLGGIVEIGAVSATGTWTLADTSVTEFVSAQRADLNRMLDIIQQLGGFTPPTMAILDELGYLREHAVAAPSLLMSSSVYEEVSPRVDEPAAVRRMSRMGADLQLTRFLQALVEAAIARDVDVRRGARLIAPAIQVAVSLAGKALDDTPVAAERTVFRMWRVTYLADLLLPDSNAHPAARPLFRDYGHALDDLLRPLPLPP